LAPELGAWTATRWVCERSSKISGAPSGRYVEVKTVNESRTIAEDACNCGHPRACHVDSSSCNDKDHKGVLMPISPSVCRTVAWQTGLLSAAVLGLGALLTSSAAIAADKPIVNEKFSDLEPAIQELRKDANKDRRDIVKANMLLTNSEATRFWPLYDEYRTERSKIGDRRVKLITDYLAKRDSMTEDEAAKLAHEQFDIEKDTVSLQEKWYGKMTKDLSPRTVARFFHIESKLDAAANLALAARIPLIH
jgi:hypothetical protein